MTIDESFTVSIPITIDKFERPIDLGDSDVNTQRGRKTHVQARWGLRREDNIFRLNFQVDILEMHPDNTHLVGYFGRPGYEQMQFAFDAMTEVIEHPNEMDPDQLGVIWSSSQGFGKFVYGEEHGPVEWSVRKAGLPYFRIFIDGPGRDDRGNIELQAWLEFKFVLRHTDIESKRGTVKRPIDQIFKVTPYKARLSKAAAEWIGKSAPASAGSAAKNAQVRIVRSKKQPKMPAVPRLKATPKGTKKVTKTTPRKASPKVRLKVSQKVNPKSPKRPVAKRASRK